MKNVQDKRKEFMGQYNQKEANKKDQAALQKKNGVKLTYEEQKALETGNFADQQSLLNHQIDSNCTQLEIFSSILAEISQKDKTYMNILGPISEYLITMNSNFQQHSTIQAKLYNDMSKQSEEFLRRYTNVKNRNQTSDKVLNEMKKQLGCYKEEIENMQKMEAHLTVENYQKLVNDFN